MFVPITQALRLAGSGVFILTMVAGTALAQKAQEKSPEKAKPTSSKAGPSSQKAAAKPAAKGSAGMVVARDPQTGELRAPTAEEMQALQSQSSITTGSQAPQAVAAPQSGAGLTLGEDSQTYAVVHKNPDGTISFGEATGKAAAEKAIKNSPIKSSTVKKGATSSDK